MTSSTGHPDEKTIFATLTIKTSAPNCRVIAFIVDRENLTHIRRANADEIILKAKELKTQNVKMAGKTGTVQVIRISEEEREKGIIKNKDRVWKKRDHALFVGYAPLEKPKYSICVIVEHGGSGSTIAAPVSYTHLTLPTNREV